MEFRLLGSLVDRKIGYGIVQPGQSIDEGIPVIKVNNLIAGLKSVKELDTTSIETATKYSRTKLKGGELIVSVVGTIGKTAIVPADFAGCNLVRATALIDIPEQWLSHWVKYYIDSPAGQAYIDQNLNMLNAYRVLLTRARAGMVICVPTGNPNKNLSGFWEDSTRLPEYYDGTYHYLKKLGLDEI